MTVAKMGKRRRVTRLSDTTMLITNMSADVCRDLVLALAIITREFPDMPRMIMTTKVNASVTWMTGPKGYKLFSSLSLCIIIVVVLLSMIE
jgi:hypothetical protein